MNVCWFSAGVSSFVAAYLSRNIIDKIIYCHIDDQHDDTMRFVRDCEKKLGGAIEIMQSEYKSVDGVIKTFRFVNGPYGAKCTDILKKLVRKEWEYGKTNLSYIWGYDADERHRIEKIKESNPNQNHIFPLAERYLTKSDCHALNDDIGVKRPAMYDMGYRNNNCIGCVKGGMGYWNKVRADFPEIFHLRARREREICHSCIKGIYLDELKPDRGNPDDEIMPDCSIACQMIDIG